MAQDSSAAAPAGVDANQTSTTDDGRFSRLVRFLTHSEQLPQNVWRTRHRFIVSLAVAHVPVLFALGLVLRGDTPIHSGAEAVAISTLSLAALNRHMSRKVQELLATMALLSCSAMLVHVTGGSVEAHFHFFVVLPVVALYQSWPPFLLALGYVLVHHGLIGQLWPESVYNHPAAINNPWKWAAIHAFFVSAASAVFVVMWRLNESARSEARDLYRQLYEGERAIVQQLEAAATMKDELVSVVSHELRTPLTSILGFGQLLRDVDGSEGDQKEWLDRLLRQGDRLQFLVENLLNTAKAPSDSTDVAEVREVLEDVLGEQADYPNREDHGFKYIVPEGLKAQISPRSLRLILANLVNNALKHRIDGGLVSITTWLEPAPGRDVAVVAVTNRGENISEADRERMFDAFVQLDSSITRRVAGVGLGLHIVRETAVAHGGSVDVKCVGNEITFLVRLPVPLAAHKRANSPAA
ncbi:MAG: HAMP domain-containing sensor histidine kinase [Actinomycetota bacterium]